MSQVNTVKSRHPEHPGRAGWQEAETARLFTAVKEANASGAPLRSVFESLSSDLGRSPRQPPVPRLFSPSPRRKPMSCCARC